MKRFVVPFLAVLSLLIPLTSHAEWVTKEVKWRISGIGPTGTSTTVWARDTIYQAVNVDTSAVFSLDDATVPPRGVAFSGGGTISASGTAFHPNAQDSTTIAWLLIQSDSSVATTATATNVTVLVDGRVGAYGPNPQGLATGNAEGWVKADSVFINGAAGGTMTTGDDSYGIPIHSVSPYGNVLRWPDLRARVTTATGSIPAARIFLRYYRPDVNSHY